MHIRLEKLYRSVDQRTLRKDTPTKTTPAVITFLAKVSVAASCSSRDAGASRCVSYCATQKSYLSPFTQAQEAKSEA